MMNFDWSVITAIATIIGVIGGLISVVFLILEVRRNAQAIEGSTVQSLMNFEKDVFTLIASNAPLYLKGSNGLSKLTAVQRLTFNRIVGVQMSLTYSAYVQYQNQLIDDEVWEAYHNALKTYMKAPGFSECWKSFESHYPKSFQDVVRGGEIEAQTKIDKYF
jgi:hypothetical protein